MDRTVVSLLRVAFAMCFVGHGAFGLLRKPDWLPFFGAFGIGEGVAQTLMPLVGMVDIALGVAALVRPLRVVFAYGAVWCLFTAALRPMTGQGLAEFFERAGNYGIPIVMLLVTRGVAWFHPVPREVARSVWPTVYAGAAWTTATLLIGHAWLALQSKPLLVRHLAQLGLEPTAAPLLGVLELMLAVMCVVRPGVGVFAFIAAWKVGTEALFVADGAPVWEVIERGGSYVAPMLAACLAPATPSPVLSLATLRAPGVVLLVSVVSVPLAAQTSLLEQLQRGGLVVACRHAITSRDREDRQPVDLADPSTQRVLSAQGEAQARALGEEWQSLGIRFHTTASSPYDRARRTVELALGRVEINPALSMRTGDKGEQLRELMHGPVAAGGNRLVMTHQGVLYRSFPTVKEGSVAEGACIVARPGPPSAEVLAIVRPGQWRGGR